MATENTAEMTILEGLEGLEPLSPFNSPYAHEMGFNPKSTSNPSNPSTPEVFRSALSVLNHCSELDIRLWAEDGRLCYDAPTGALNATLKAELIARKGEFITLITWSSAWSASDAPPIALFKAPPESDAVPIDVPHDWRWAAANLPGEQWGRWRRLATDLLAGQDDEPTAEDVRAAECAAYDLLRTDGGIA